MVAGQPLRGLLGFPGQGWQRLRGFVGQTMALPRPRFAGFYFAVGGGGAGGSAVSFGQGGGGGGGGVKFGRLSLLRGSTHQVNVGLGANYPGPSGDTYLETLVRVRGGGNGNSATGAGNDGASGGGAGNAAIQPGGAGVPGQGNDGGPGTDTGGLDGFGEPGSGGGAGGPGSNGGLAGIGLLSNIPGDATLYGKGGPIRAGGADGAAGTGEGGGGGYGLSVGTSGSGGSGKFVWFYPGPRKCSGGTITSVFGFTIHTFLTSGSLTTPKAR